MPIRAVTVYLSSSRDLAPAYVDAATALGTALARQGWALVYGGNSIGLMHTLAEAARAAGGRVVGITPRLFVDENCADTTADELIVTDDMRTRKRLLEERGDALIAMPGGLGTFEELFEVLVGRVLRYHDKPIVLLNVAGYYDPLIAMIEHGIEQRFIKPKAREAYFVADTVETAMTYLRDWSAGRAPHGHPEGEPSAKE
ncbi:MAG TPA: TIGR00730 family Rossman fold protein [Humisphaera sp.]